MLRQHLAGDELRRAGASDQHRTDHDIGGEHFSFDRYPLSRQCAHAAFEQLIELAQARQRAIDDRDFSAKADGHTSGMRADDTAAKHDDLGRTNAGHAAHQHAASARRTAQCNGSGFDRKAAGDFAHRREQRKPAVGIGYGFVGDGGCARCHQAAGLLWIGSEMEIGEQDLVRLQPAYSTA